MWGTTWFNAGHSWRRLGRQRLYLDAIGVFPAGFSAVLHLARHAWHKHQVEHDVHLERITGEAAKAFGKLFGDKSYKDIARKPKLVVP